MKIIKRCMCILIAFTLLQYAFPSIPVFAKRTDYYITSTLTKKGKRNTIQIEKGSKVQIISISGTKAINLSDLRYSSNNDDVATVSDTGLIKSLKAGNAKITITTKSGNKKSILALKVVKSLKVNSVRLSRKSIHLKLGMIYKLTVKTDPEYATNSKVIWRSSNKSVATIDNGIISPISKGTTTITAIVGKKSAKCKVTVSGDYKDDLVDHIIPSDLANDPIYCSMNTPSEAMSDFSRECHRNYGRILGYTTPKHTSAVSIGAIYLESGKKMNRDFTICLGQIALFAYSSSQKKWIVVDRQRYPQGLKLYKLPWSSRVHRDCENISYFPDHVEIKLNATDLNNYAFHYWGERKPINNSDYKYFACAYKVWVKEDYSSNILTTEGGIDTKFANGDNNNVIQIVTSRSLSLTTTPKTLWCHTIPNDEYKYKRDGAKLIKLFK
ncbi:Ig-like domain-containing protein [Butyrivibrio sp. WCD2001]|uniref:Ig-like domain-containing protein n=1 Tax=Butyrivibrio sp. WCD2001 TaxID=1280681 RepID=UPI0003F60302|nr:Ig-like domain-containing protein [Butyrivibrio sp. WCD2001]